MRGIWELSGASVGCAELCGSSALALVSARAAACTPPAMFGGSPGAGAVSAGTVEKWVENEALNEFANGLDIAPYCAQALKDCAEPDRRRFLVILQTKMAQLCITNPSTYLNGIIRNEKQGGFGGRSWGHGGRPMQHGPPSLPPSAVQRVPTPQQTPRGVKRPAWVSEAWSLALKPSALMKKMHGVLGAESMASLSAWPPQIQLSVLTALVYSEGAWADPAAALSAALATMGTLPVLQVNLATRSARKGRALVVLQLGAFYGAEWVLLQSAIDGLKADVPDLYVHGEHAFLGQRGPVDLFRAVKPDVTLHTDADALADLASKAHGEWCALDACVLVLVTCPAPSVNCNAAYYPGYHSSDASDLWLFLKALRGLQPILDNKLAFMSADPVVPHSARAELLGKVFGKAFEVTAAKARVPASAWRFRSHPAISESDLAVRKVDVTSADDIYAKELRELREGSRDDPVLPCAQELEEYNDVVSFGDKDHGGANVYELLQTAAAGGGSGAGARRLLSRADLSRLWGLEGWAIDEAHLRLHPCCGRCDALTGFPVTAGGVSCGESRYCMRCESWYKRLFDSPPPRIFSLISRVLRASLEMKAPCGIAPGWADLQPHSCDGEGCKR